MMSRRRRWRLGVALGAVWLWASALGCSPEGAPPPGLFGAREGGPPRGILQFHVTHNLQTPDCRATMDCNLDFEEKDDVPGWLSVIAEDSEVAILHWDRAIPWLVFDADPPMGANPVAHYDPQLDAGTLAYLDAFAAHFSSMDLGFLAVSILSGERSQIAPLLLGDGTALDIPGVCPEIASGVQVTVSPGGAPQVFDLERSYRNFLLYLIAKLGPDYIALMVEANLFTEFCPGRADAFYALYRSLYDSVRAAVGPDPMLFATLSYLHLLAYDPIACFGGQNFVSCKSGRPPAPTPISSEACYPTDRSAIDALEQGDRLDLLALSFYPDALEMKPPGAKRIEGRLHRAADYLAGDTVILGGCLAYATWPDMMDPFAALDRLGWTGPVAIAETSARSCTSTLWYEDPGFGPLIVWAPGSSSAQEAWLEHLQDWSREKDMEFFAYSFLKDYTPLGPWLVDIDVMTPTIFSLFQTWTCSGLYDEDGRSKGRVTRAWRNAEPLPEEP
jgi:hypothetical protein